MKKKQPQTKRLVLNKERIRQLENIQLTNVNGGVLSTDDCGSAVTPKAN